MKGLTNSHLKKLVYIFLINNNTKNNHTFYFPYLVPPQQLPAEVMYGSGTRKTVGLRLSDTQAGLVKVLTMPDL